MGRYIQYGCGTWVPDGWDNFDVTPALFVQHVPLVGRRLAPIRFPAAVRHGDICRGLPVSDGSAEAVYCSHVLEHLAVDDLRRALRNTLRMLRPGGAFRLVVPDLRAMAEAYLGSREPSAGFGFVDGLGMGRLSRRSGPVGLLRAWLGSSAHRWMWDYESMAVELTAAGFGSVRRAEIGDSGDPMFARAEQPDRWAGALGMHCCRPDVTVDSHDLG